MNSVKTFILLGVMTGLFLLIGNAMGGEQGMVYALLFACATNFISYWFSDKIVLAMYGAKPVSEAEAPELVGIVKKLAVKANIPMPKVYLMSSPVPNAFATGRNPQHAAVAATTGILERLNARELEGVLGHELAHVFNRDILIGTIAASLAGAVMTLSRMAMWFGGGHHDHREGNRGNALVAIVAMVLAPLAAMLIQMAVSRSREYQADQSGAALTGDPLSLASALGKISDANVQARAPLSDNPATAHLFIVSPLNGQSMLSLFSTHPPILERIKRLEAMAGSASAPNAPRVIY